MPSNSLAYQRANRDKYWWSKKTMKKRAARNTARNRAIADWKVSRWDGKHIHHKNWNATDNNPKNLAVVTAKYNLRDWAKKVNKPWVRTKKYAKRIK